MSTQDREHWEAKYAQTATASNSGSALASVDWLPPARPKQWALDLACGRGRHSHALSRLGYHSRATVHGFRATFSTIANESGFDGDVIEKALAHEERNRVRAAYHRSEYIEQRRELMQWWADLLQKMESGVETSPNGEAAQG